MFKRYKVTFEPSGRSIEVDEGETILDAARSLDIALDHVCGGACACATCHVIIKEGSEKLQARSDDEQDMLQGAAIRDTLSRLACQTEITTDLVVTIPR